MTYDILLAEEAQGQLKALPKVIQRKIVVKIEQLAMDPYPQGAKKLKGYDTFYRTSLVSGALCMMLRSSAW